MVATSLLKGHPRGTLCAVNLGLFVLVAALAVCHFRSSHTLWVRAVDFPSVLPLLTSVTVHPSVLPHRISCAQAGGAGVRPSCLRVSTLDESPVDGGATQKQPRAPTFTPRPNFELPTSLTWAVGGGSRRHQKHPTLRRAKISDIYPQLAWLNAKACALK